MSESIVGILSAATRLHNSRSGNPRWRLKVSGNVYTTKLDTQTAQSMAPDQHLGDVVQISFDVYKRITKYEVLP